MIPEPSIKILQRFEKLKTKTSRLTIDDWRGLALLMAPPDLNRLDRDGVSSAMVPPRAGDLDLGSFALSVKQLFKLGTHSQLPSRIRWAIFAWREATPEDQVRWLTFLVSRLFTTI